MKNNKTYKSEIVDTILKESSPILRKQISLKLKIAKKIDDVRKNNNWSKLDLAKAFNKHPSIITKWLNGTYNFTIDTLVEIEEVLNIKLFALGAEKEESYYALLSDEEIKKSIPYPESTSNAQIWKNVGFIRGAMWLKSQLKEGYSSEFIRWLSIGIKNNEIELGLPVFYRMDNIEYTLDELYQYWKTEIINTDE